MRSFAKEAMFEKGSAGQRTIKGIRVFCIDPGVRGSDGGVLLRQTVNAARKGKRQKSLRPIASMHFCMTMMHFCMKGLICGKNQVKGERIHGFPVELQ